MFLFHFPIIFMATVWPAKNTILINFKIISSKAKLMTRIFYLLWSGAFKYSSFWVSNSSTRCFNKAKLNRVQMAKVNPEIICCTQRNRGLVWIEEFKKRRPRLLYFYCYMFYKALSSTWYFFPPSFVLKKFSALDVPWLIKKSELLRFKNKTRIFIAIIRVVNFQKYNSKILPQKSEF